MIMDRIEQEARKLAYECAHIAHVWSRHNWPDGFPEPPIVDETRVVQRTNIGYRVTVTVNIERVKP